MKQIIFSTVALLACGISAPAAEVWAPGIYKQGDEYVGWYDYQKTGTDDTGLCWAMTSPFPQKWEAMPRRDTPTRSGVLHTI